MNGSPQRTQPGFTLIEVMIAIGIMTVGSLGILSMHHAVSGANRSAHELNTALAITERWIERIERDSLAWSVQGLNSTELTGTAYLSPLAGTVGTTGWFRPTPADSDEHYAFDYFGEDTATSAEIKYCTNLRLSWLRQGSSAGSTFGRFGSARDTWAAARRTRIGSREALSAAPRAMRQPLTVGTSTRRRT